MFTGIHRDMKNHLLEIEDKLFMRKRSIIESVFNVLKNNMNLEHTRYRSPLNFLVHIIACIVSYALTYLEQFTSNSTHFLILNSRYIQEKFVQTIKLCLDGGIERIRTSDLVIRNHSLYPAELRPHIQ